MEESALRKLLRNEYAQIAMIAGAIMYFVTNVTLPMQAAQIQLTQIQATLLEIKTNYSNLDARVTTNSNDIITLKDRLNKYNIR